MAGLYIPCGNPQTMWSCLCKMCHCLCDNFPPYQHQQHHVTTHSTPTTTPNSQPHYYEQMQVKGPKDDKHHLGPKHKLPNIVFFCFTNCPSQFCYYQHCPSLLHPHVCALPTSSVPSPCHLCPPHVICALPTLSVPSSHCLCPMPPLQASACRVATATLCFHTT